MYDSQLISSTLAVEAKASINVRAILSPFLPTRMFFSHHSPFKACQVMSSGSIASLCAKLRGLPPKSGVACQCARPVSSTRRRAMHFTLCANPLIPTRRIFTYYVLTSQMEALGSSVKGNPHNHYSHRLIDRRRLETSPVIIYLQRPLIMNAVINYSYLQMAGHRSMTTARSKTDYRSPHVARRSVSTYRPLDKWLQAGQDTSISRATGSFDGKNIISPPRTASPPDPTLPDI